jgi:hypothetical protein
MKEGGTEYGVYVRGIWSAYGDFEKRVRVHTLKDRAQAEYSDCYTGEEGFLVLTTNTQRKKRKKRINSQTPPAYPSNSPQGTSTSSSCPAHSSAPQSCSSPGRKTIAYQSDGLFG